MLHYYMGRSSAGPAWMAWLPPSRCFVVAVAVFTILLPALPTATGHRWAVEQEPSETMKAAAPSASVTRQETIYAAAPSASVMHYYETMKAAAPSASGTRQET